MKINWKLRFKNAAVLTALVGCVIAFVYQVLGIFDIVPSVCQSDVVEYCGLIINLLVALGIVVDPTTAGIGDSKTAQSYSEPRIDETE